MASDHSLIVALAEGNPGAATVLLQLWEYSPELLDVLVELDIRGAAIWMLYEDECGMDIRLTASTIVERYIMAHS